MKVTIQQLMDARLALQGLVGREMSARTAFQIARIVVQVNEELQQAEKVRGDLFERLGEEQEDGTREITEEHKEEFAEQLEELITTEIGFSFGRIAVDKLPDMSLGWAMALDWLVDMGEEQDGNS